MPCVLAIESHAGRADALRDLVGRRVREPLTVVDSVEAALRSIGQRVPEIVLISPLMHPQDEAALVSRLRSLPKTSFVQTLIAPQLAPQAPAGSRQRSRRAPLGADDNPGVFADELEAYVAMVRDRRVDLAAAEELSSPADRRTSARIASVDCASLAVDGSPVDVVDLSLTGAQVLAPSLLVPGRTVDVVFDDRRRAMRCRAAIVWGALEASQATAGLHYRAGLDFRDGDREFLERLCAGQALAVRELDVPDSFGRVLFTRP